MKSPDELRAEVDEMAMEAVLARQPCCDCDKCRLLWSRADFLRGYRKALEHARSSDNLRFRHGLQNCIDLVSVDRLDAIAAKAQGGK